MDDYARDTRYSVRVSQGARVSAVDNEALSIRETMRRAKLPDFIFIGGMASLFEPYLKMYEKETFGGGFLLDHVQLIAQDPGTKIEVINNKAHLYAGGAIIMSGIVCVENASRFEIFGNTAYESGGGMVLFGKSLLLARGEGSVIAFTNNTAFLQPIMNHLDNFCYSPFFNRNVRHRM